MPHHYGIAFHAALQSPFEPAVCLTVDESGDQHIAVLWRKDGERLDVLRESSSALFWLVLRRHHRVPRFEAYDGEYKVMGLAAYGGPTTISPRSWGEWSAWLPTAWSIESTLASSTTAPTPGRAATPTSWARCWAGRRAAPTRRSRGGTRAER